ncbi:hypothetical protein [Aliarcobacter butzleri]|uniref:hypothetical protein n=1 Tax=Aliarcobacter butzleri TaxID=28197 RepID=UPI001EE0EC3B|nr:hypothetical protein [Aliarcobacter butzleri]MCG3680124.1 hypothetical protein [Aliarcobacter butzleri]
MGNIVKEEKCLFCGHNNLEPSKVAFPQKRSAMSVSLRRDGEPSYIEDEYAEFDIKRCKSCGYIHMFFHPTPLSKSTIK